MDGKAGITDQATNATLRVRIFWPFSGDCWIIDLGEDYEYAVVGHPSRIYLWILVRTHYLSDPARATVVSKERWYETPATQEEVRE